jgi:hypothetical protein
MFAHTEKSYEDNEEAELDEALILDAAEDIEETRLHMPI